MRYRQWTQKEIDLLLQNYETMKTDEITEQLNGFYPEKEKRTSAGVEGKARYLGLKMPPPDYEFFKNGKTVAFGSIHECAKQLNMKPKTLYNHVSKKYKILYDSDKKYLYGVKIYE